MDVRAIAFALALAAVAGSAPSVGEPLPKEDCDRLKGEHAKLEAAGAKDNFAKGASWGRANLGGDRLKQVERYIYLEEQLMFRCGVASARIVLPFAEEDAPPVAPDEAKVDGAGAPAATPKAKPKPKPKVVVMPPETPQAPGAAKDAAPAKTPATQPAVAKPAPKPKPKVDDAYRPPAPANPAADPFAGKVQQKTN